MRPLLLAAATLCLVGAPLTATTARAQTPDSAAAATPRGPVLTLDQAIALAIKNNPAHLQVVEARKSASAAVRSAYGAFLPDVSASLSGAYRKSGESPFQGINIGATADRVSSSYDISLRYNLSADMFMRPGLASANSRAAQADIVGDAANVRMQVTQQYLTALASQANASLQDTIVVQLQRQVELARAKLAVGSGTQIELGSAEVKLGQAQVTALQAHNQVEIDKLTLFQEMGVPQPADVQLVSTFAVEPPPITLDSALALARSRNPALNALRARKHAADLNVRVAQSSYLPSLSFGTGWGGFTNAYADGDFAVEAARQGVMSARRSCFGEDSLRTGAGLPSIGTQCAGIDFGPADAAAARKQNDVFPFGFTKSPFSFSVGISLPIFNGFQREQTIEQAEVQRNTQRYQIKGQELLLTQSVTSAYLQLETAQKTIAMQERNATNARQALLLAQEQYRVGAASYIDLDTALVAYVTAESARITAIYDYHKAFAALEGAVGRQLR
jgi:outer membrane protein